MKSLALALVVVGILTMTSGASDVVDMQLNRQASSIDGNLELQTFLPGFLIGNYDEVTNPEGTLTRPGLFGGSGNQPVDLDMTANLNGDIDSMPVGGYRLAVDFESLSVEISDFQLDVLGEQPGMLDLTLDWSFESFRTFQPTSLFPGVPLSLPIGNGELSVLNIQQSGAVLASELIPQGPNDFSFSLVIPATITIESEIFGQPLAPPPFEVAVALAGQMIVAGNQIMITQSFDQTAGDEISDLPGGEYSDIPFPVPTVVPPGATADLLLSGNVDTISFDLNLNAALTAEGELSTVLLGDLNGDDRINLLDVGPFVEAVISGKYLQTADMNCDGSVDHGDVMPFIASLYG